MAYLIFILLYTPCAAAMGAYVREFGQKYSVFIAGVHHAVSVYFRDLLLPDRSLC